MKTAAAPFTRSPGINGIMPMESVFPQSNESVYLSHGTPSRYMTAIPAISAAISFTIDVFPIRQIKDITTAAARYTKQKSACRAEQCGKP